VAVAVAVAADRRAAVAAADGEQADLKVGTTD
jgi:hypothetical protein